MGLKLQKATHIKVRQDNLGYYFIVDEAWQQVRIGRPGMLKHSTGEEEKSPLQR
ncbi:hypothetical protein PoB_001289200 [Plakobranchus ocellatus]|uniref:Uncharacterized protein n=1 Tax=Plakobranchus ocellatus TaxID=259542 RepID=A0AAV3YTV5_9GAST|nr:hypothetical protein PoB_001289200 [Plakobranchus ocellatus]